jgi:hypothetical protein
MVRMLEFGVIGGYNQLQHMIQDPIQILPMTAKVNQ